jgi:hypothetical protein
MRFQTAMDKATAEAVFRSVTFGVTRTTTITNTAARTLYQGEPVVLSTNTIGVGGLGQEVIRPLTATNVVINRMVVGPLASATLAMEDVGLVQVYGVAPVRMAEAATWAVGDQLVPDVNTTATALAPYGIGCWSAKSLTTGTDFATQNILNGQAGCHVVVAYPATAVSGTNSYTNAYAFIRAL